MRIHSLACSSLHPICERLIQGEGSYFRRGLMCCHCWLLETPSSGLVLVDTGFGEDELSAQDQRLPLGVRLVLGPTRDGSEAAAARIRQLGFSPSDVRHVILTHLDLDHAGGLSAFPAAKVHLLKSELDAATARATVFEKNRYLPRQWAHGPSWVTYEPKGESWNGLPCVRELRGLPPEILLVPLLGHTRGHAGVAVSTALGWQLHAGDAFFHRGEVDARAGEMPLGLRIFESINAIDAAGMRKNRDRLRGLVERREAHVVNSHDPVMQAAFAGSFALATTATVSA